MMGGGGGLILLLLLGLVVFAHIKVFPDWQDRVGLNNRREEDRREDSAEEILRQRFARGEIDAEDYERSLEVLRNGRVSENGTVSEKSGAKEV
jgi:putative membrane protein